MSGRTICSCEAFPFVFTLTSTYKLPLTPPPTCRGLSFCGFSFWAPGERYAETTTNVMSAMGGNNNHRQILTPGIHIVPFLPSDERFIHKRAAKRGCDRRQPLHPQGMPAVN